MAQGAGHRFLADDFFEGAGTPFEVQGTPGHAIYPFPNDIAGHAGVRH
jgi:hypothetical protein